MDCFRRMIAHLRSLILFRFSIGFVENIVAKYCATVVGWYTMSRPFFSTTNTEMMNKSKTKLMEVNFLMETVIASIYLKAEIR